MNKNSIGKKLQSLRKQKGISMQELAEYLHISRQTISKWESDLRLPDIDMLMKMCDYYEISINDVLSSDKEENVKDIYLQLQQMLESLQKQNKRRQIFNIVLICISIISLCVSLTLGSKLNELPKEKVNDFSLKYSINEINENSDLLLMSSKNNMEMKANLNSWDAKISYYFVLKEYTVDTKLSIEFHDKKEKIKFDFDKQTDNEFSLNETIPLKNYDNVYLIVDDGSGYLKAENIGINRNCYYLDNAITSFMSVYIPLNESKQLDLSKVVYQPTKYGKDIYYNARLYENSHVNGSMDICIMDYYDDEKVYLKRQFNPNEETVFELDEPLPLNEKLFLYVSLTYFDQDGEQQRTFCANVDIRGYVNAVTIQEQSEPFYFDIDGAGM